MTKQVRVDCRSSLRRAAIAALLCLAGAGCTYTTDLQSPGTLAVQPLGVRPSLPPRAEQAVPVGPPPSGAYAGTAVALNNPGGVCQSVLRIRRFVVSGDRVRFQAFRGTVGANGELRMQAGESFIDGAFGEGRFVGRLWRRQPSCTYRLELDHVG